VRWAPPAWLPPAEGRETAAFGEGLLAGLEAAWDDDAGRLPGAGFCRLPAGAPAPFVRAAGFTALDGTATFCRPTALAGTPPLAVGWPTGPPGGRCLFAGDWPGGRFVFAFQVEELICVWFTLMLFQRVEFTVTEPLCQLQLDHP